VSTNVRDGWVLMDGRTVAYREEWQEHFHWDDWEWTRYRRYHVVMAMREAGLTFREIGLAHDVCATRARQIYLAADEALGRIRPRPLLADFDAWQAPTLLRYAVALRVAVRSG
jgi:hypothetical protein